jgi:hypothetical protein
MRIPKTSATLLDATADQTTPTWDFVESDSNADLDEETLKLLRRCPEGPENSLDDHVIAWHFLRYYREFLRHYSSASEENLVIERSGFMGMGWKVLREVPVHGGRDIYASRMWQGDEAWYTVGPNNDVRITVCATYQLMGPRPV